MNDDWKTPIPLEKELQSEEYPINYLPSIIRNAVISYQKYGQQPLPMIASSALANVSLACQTLANVARDPVLISPVSLYFIVAAASGERKSAADKFFGAGIQNWQSRIRDQLKDQASEQLMLHRVWHNRKEGLLKQIRKLAMNGEPSLHEEAQLQELIHDEPHIIMLPELFFEDVTQEALISQLANGWPSSSLWSDEGGIVLASHSMKSNATKFVATLNRLWDGNPFIAHRKNSATINVANRRLTINLMLQPLLLDKMLSRADGVVRQSEFLARSLIAYPRSEMGQRNYKEPTSSTIPELDKFHCRITECLDSTLQLDSSGCHAIPTLNFTSSGKAAWVDYFNQIEHGLKLTNKWLTVQDFASKAAENVARLAALFHLFTGTEGSIQRGSVEQAIHIIDWHLKEAKRVLNPELGANINQDAHRLLSWLTSHQQSKVAIRSIQQNGPSQIRKKAKLKKVLDLLAETNHIRYVRDGRKHLVEINSNLNIEV